VGLFLLPRDAWIRERLREPDEDGQAYLCALHNGNISTARPDLERYELLVPASQIGHDLPVTASNCLLPSGRSSPATQLARSGTPVRINTMRIGSLLRPAAIGVLLLSCNVRTISASETVTFKSGDKVLHGLFYKPAGVGPFPAVLFNHGSAPGLLNNQAFDLIGPMFTARGWVFFAPYRRGQGLSSDAGPYIED
jgi:hypothetical protein